MTDAPQAQELAQEFGDALARVSRAAKAAAGEALREMGVHAGQNFVLDELRREDELTPGALAQRIGVDVSTITRTAQRMEAAGLVRRLPDRSDARLIRVALTDAGRAAADRVPDVLGAVYERMLAPLAAEDRAALVALLRRVVDGLDT